MKRLVLSLATVMAFAGAFAQSPEAKDAQNGALSPELSALKLATELVKYGNESRTALPFVEAAQIIINTDTQTLNEQKEGEAADKDGASLLDVNNLLAQAKTYADGDAATLAIIDQVASEAAARGNRGAVGGPKYTTEVVRAHSTDRYTISFRAGQTAEVGVSGDGDTDLDLYVYDSNGNLIAKDDDYTDTCYVSWTPRWTGNFTIKVVNRGGVANRYVILTN